MTESNWSAVTQQEGETRMIPEEGLTENAVTVAGSQHAVEDLGAQKVTHGRPRCSISSSALPGTVPTSDSDLRFRPHSQ